MFKLKNSPGWRTATVLVWALVVISGWYWTQSVIAASKLPGSVVPRTAIMDDLSSPISLSKLLGATPPTVAGPGPADRFVLSGVIASSVGLGAALIAVDGKPARPFEVGSELAPGYVLVSVATREAMLAEGLNVPIRAILSLPLQRSAETSVAPQGAASSTSTLAPISAVAPSSGVSNANSAPVVAEQISPVPARADARRQPQTTLQRDDRRTP